jgi:hypothetical protein
MDTLRDRHVLRTSGSRRPHPGRSGDNAVHVDPDRRYPYPEPGTAHRRMRQPGSRLLHRGVPGTRNRSRDRADEPQPEPPGRHRARSPPPGFPARGDEGRPVHPGSGLRRRRGRPSGIAHLRAMGGVELSADNRRSLVVPEGCAHGFQTLADDTELLYSASRAYAPTHERGSTTPIHSSGSSGPDRSARSRRKTRLGPRSPPPARSHDGPDTIRCKIPRRGRDRR